MFSVALRTIWVSVFLLDCMYWSIFCGPFKKELHDPISIMIKVILHWSVLISSVFNSYNWKAPGGFCVVADRCYMRSGVVGGGDWHCCALLCAFPSPWESTIKTKLLKHGKLHRASFTQTAMLHWDFCFLSDLDTLYSSGMSYIKWNEM